MSVQVWARLEEVLNDQEWNEGISFKIVKVKDGLRVSLDNFKHRIYEERFTSHYPDHGLDQIVNEMINQFQQKRPVINDSESFVFHKVLPEGVRVDEQRWSDLTKFIQGVLIDKKLVDPVTRLVHRGASGDFGWVFDQKPDGGVILKEIRYKEEGHWITVWKGEF